MPSIPKKQGRSIRTARPSRCELVGEGQAEVVRGPRTSGVGCPLNSTYSSIRAPRQGQPSPNGSASVSRLPRPNGEGSNPVPLPPPARLKACILCPNLLAIIQSQGATTLRSISAALNRQGIKSPNGGAWHPSSVANLIERSTKQAFLQTGKSRHCTREPVLC